MLSGFFAGVEGAVIHERRLYSDTGPILSPMRPKASVDPSTGPGPVNRRASYNSAGSMCCSLAAQWDIEESKVDIEGHEEEAEFAIRQDAARRLLDRVRRAFQDCPPQTGAEAAQMCYDTLVNSDDWPDSFELQVQKVLARQGEPPGVNACRAGSLPEYHSVLLTCGYVSTGEAFFATRDTDGEFMWAALEQPSSPVSVAPELAFLPQGHGSVLCFTHADYGFPLLP